MKPTKIKTNRSKQPAKKPPPEAPAPPEAPEAPEAPKSPAPPVTPVTRVARPVRARQSNRPVLRFAPNAWAKLLWLRDRGAPGYEHEIGGFGVCETNDLLLVTDFVTVTQDVTAISVEFDDQAVADFFDRQVDAGRKPEQFSRIWIHTHPGDSPHPSPTDEDTFERVFGRCDWAVMFIIAQGGATYCRLRFNTGPGGDIQIPVTVDYCLPFPGAEHDPWEAEYRKNIRIAHAHFGCGLLDEQIEAWDGPFSCAFCHTMGSMTGSGLIRCASCAQLCCHDCVADNICQDCTEILSAAVHDPNERFLDDFEIDEMALAMLPGLDPGVEL